MGLNVYLPKTRQRTSRSCLVSSGFYLVRLFLQECGLTILLLFHYSLKHPTKYVGKKTRKYVIPAKPITPLHLRAQQQQQQAAGQADQQAVASGGQGSGPQGGSEVQMYRETSSGGLHGTPYNKVKPSKHSFILTHMKESIGETIVKLEWRNVWNK